MKADVDRRRTCLHWLWAGLVIGLFGISPLSVKAQLTSQKVQAPAEEAQAPEGDEGGPVRVGDRWVYDTKDELTGYPKDTYTEIVTEVSPAATRAELRSELDRLSQNFLRGSMQDAPGIYARHFTADELRDMIAFYHTPTGEKALRMLPPVMSELMATMLPRLQNLEPQLKEAFAKVLRQKGI